MMEARGEGILAALGAEIGRRPELKGFLGFYREIYQAQFAVEAELPPATCRLLPQEAADRLDKGQRLLAFADLELTLGPFAQAVEAVGRVVERHNPEWVGICELFSAEELLEDAHRQFRDRHAPWRRESLCSMTVALALTPFVQHKAEAYRPLLDDALWRRGHCPLCGSWPHISFLEREVGARRLHCARCDTWWSFDRVRCPYCGETDTMLYYGTDDQVYRLYVCDECKGYVKTLDLRKTDRQPEPFVERLVTISMDLAAQEQGFGFQAEDQPTRK